MKNSRKAITANVKPGLRAQTVKLFESVKSGNTKEIARLASSNYIFIDEEGLMAARAACAEAFQATFGASEKAEPILAIDSFSFDDVKTRTFDNTVIETMTYSDEGKEKRKGVSRSQAFKRKLRVTNVWVKQREQWQLVSTQLTPMRLD